MTHLSRIGRTSLHNLNKEHKTSEVGQLKTLRALVHVFSAVVTGITVLAAAAALFIWLLRIAGTFAFFQIAMPLIGWICVHTIAERFAAFQKAVPWIALVLLLFLTACSRQPLRAFCFRQFSQRP